MSADTGRLVLVGDLGGTNARFGLANLDDPDLSVVEARDYKGRDFDSPAAAIEAYLCSSGSPRPSGAVIAVAGPVRNDTIAFTNSAWRLRVAELRDLGFDRAELINDYAALAFASPLLRGEQLLGLGPDLPLDQSRTLAVVGPGTGFGVSALVRDGGGRPVAVAGEGGHIGFAPADPLEVEVLRVLSGRHGRVSLERLLSGPGLADLHDALGQIEGLLRDALAPESVTEGALGGDPTCRRTVDLFCAILGSAAGDFALSFGATGGVLVAGGIAPRIADILRDSAFRDRFEAKGRFEAYMAAIPTRVIVKPHAALTGAAHYARTRL